MSGWQLGLTLLGCLVAGFGFGLVAVWAYARHVFKSKMGELAGQLTGAQPIVTTSSGFGHIDPPPLIPLRTCAACGASVAVPTSAAWPERCPHCGATPFSTAA